MAKQNNNNYPKSDSAGGTRAGRASVAKLDAQVQQRRNEAIRQQIATDQAIGRGPSDVNYVSWYDAQQAALPSPSETVE